MAVTQHTRRLLRQTFGVAAGEQIADIADAGSGSCSIATEHQIRKKVANNQAGDLIITALNDDSALGDYAQRHLAYALGSFRAAADVAEELG